MSISRNGRGSDAVARMAGLIIVNAMIFQEVLADYEDQCQHLRETLQSDDPITAFADHWHFIITQINYHPIFHVAYQLLLALPANPDADAAVRSLAERALEVVRLRAALSHDLMGRVYHKLLAEAKYLGTYYTSVPAATLLLKLALNRARWPRDWSDLGELSRLRVGDLACGTGTLLMAAAETITDNYLHASGERHKRPATEVLWRLLMEDIIYGYDVLPSALHLTASTLALRLPEVTFSQMRLWALPLGGPSHQLGSIEFLREFQVSVQTDMFGGAGEPEKVTARGDRRRRYARLPDLDLCVMNPPFTRSTGGNLLFGSLPQKERAALQKELADLLRRRDVMASSTAGLGSVFVATGDLHLKTEGRMALVLPKALLSGVAWKETRDLFRLKYQLEYLIVSHDPDRWNFSENTALSEVLVVARKLDGAGKTPPPVAESSICVNLWRNPTNAIEALTIAYAVARGSPPDLETGQGALEVTQGDIKVAEVVSVPWVSLREGLWMPPCAYAQSDLLRAVHHLTRGSVHLPGRGIVGNVPLCPLSRLGGLGPDRRDVQDGFRLASGRTAYPAFWGHDASTMTTMAQAPNRHLSPRHRAIEGRSLRRVEDLWPKAGRLLLAERLRLNTQRLAAVLLDVSVLSNVWRPLTLCDEGEEREKALALWLNSTLGLLVRFAFRVETQGPWIESKKLVLAAMPVLDVGALGQAQRQALVQAYDRLCQETLLPFPKMDQDPTRQAIDGAIAQALGLPDFGVLRQLLAREPVVCLRPLYGP